MKTKLMLLALLMISLSSIAQETGSFTDSRDGKIYKTVKIGTQTWMAENLKTTKFSNGDAILNVPDSISWLNLSSGGYCSYKNEPDNASKFGLLYNFKAVSDKRNLCPAGWHVPVMDEINILGDFLGGQEIAGEKLKSTSGWYEGGNGTNTSGFNGEPFGFRSINAGYFGLSISSSWWISNGVPFSLSYLWNQYETQPQRDGAGRYVRCIKDK